MAPNDKKSTSTMQKEYCIPRCKFGRKEGTGKKDGDAMIRCCLCMQWYHEGCIDGSSGGIWNCNSCRNMPALVASLVDFVQAMQAEISALKTECHALRDANQKLCDNINTNELNTELTLMKTKLANIEAKLSDGDQISLPNTISASVPTQPALFSEMVKSSVKAVFQHEHAKNDVIIKGMKENNTDENDVISLCDKVQAVTKPKDLVRLGKPNAKRPRLLKASFQTSYEARGFLSRFDACKKGDAGALPKDIRCRPSRTREEQEKRNALSSQVFKLNQDVGTDGGISYSLRQNGEIWKFAKQESGKWRRVLDWSFKSGTQGNGDAALKTPNRSKQATN